MNINMVAIPALKLTRGLLGSEMSATRRMYASVSQGEVHPGYIKIREKYKHFQVEDGVPVHLKGGPVDKFLYYLTLASCVLGVGMSFQYYYSAAFPKKQ